MRPRKSWLRVGMRAKRPTNWHPAAGLAETLPLFREETGEGTEAPAGATQKEALALALHVYWSASVELHSLGSATERAEHPDERKALLALCNLERQRKRLARELLAQVWRVQIGASDAAQAA